VRGDVLGQGSLGVVLAARDTTLDRDVVVKEVRHVYELVTYVSKEEITARVKTAVMAQARLDHPHILRVIDVQFQNDAPTIVLDRAVESLAARVERGLMPVAVVMRVLIQIGYALSHAHRQDLVHGGLKPENVLFDSGGNVKLADFGIVKVAERSADPNTSAPPVYVGRGHPSYMAPEQLHKGKVVPQADVYALGILLYEMLTGNLPGRRSPMPSSSERVVSAIGKDHVEALDDLFDRMTRDPLHERFGSIDEVLDAIYATFSAELVGKRGALLLWETDPLPPPARASSSAAADVAAPASMERFESTVITKAPVEMQDR
jgi:serine/threonine protein kinase